MTRALLLTLVIAASNPASAQDTLIYLNGDRIIGQVEEVGTDLVRYRTSSGGNSVAIVAEKRDLERIVLQNGQSFIFNLKEDGAAQSAFQARRDLIILDILAPALDHATIGYERAIGKRSSLRLRVGYIGLWRSEDQRERILSRGWLIRFGPKFKLQSGTRRFPTERDTHPLSGWYLSPEVLFSYQADPELYYAYPNYYWEYGATGTRFDYRTSAALVLTIGRQLMLSDRFAFDIHGGLGYGVHWLNGVAGNPSLRSNGDNGQYRYSHAFLGSNTPLCASGGVSFGYLFR